MKMISMMRQLSLLLIVMKMKMISMMSHLSLHLMKMKDEDDIDDESSLSTSDDEEDHIDSKSSPSLE